MSKNLKIGLFLGAGASVPYNKPTTKHLRDKLMTKYHYTDVSHISKEQEYLNSILTFSNFYDIEDVLQCIKEIDDFFLNSKFGSRYLLERVPELKFNDSRRPAHLSTFIDSIKKIRTMIENDVFENYAWNDNYDIVLEEILTSFFNILKKENSKEIHIFTTNYDRAVEEFCSDSNKKYKCVDGFNRNEYNNRRLWSGNYNFPTEEDSTNVFLYKMHGSLSWKKHKKYGIESTSEETRSNDPNYIENLLIYPTISPKDGEEKEPYKTIREKFKEFMDIADICIVIGFSFRDEHINEIFSSFLQRNKKIISISNTADKNLFKNLLKKNIESEGSYNKIEEINTFFGNENNIIAINSNISKDNIQKISKIVNYILNNGVKKKEIT